MSLVELLLTGYGLRTLVIGLVALAIALGVAALRQRWLSQGLERVRALALGGSAQEARVLARASGAWAAPLVDALAGEAVEVRAHAVGVDAAAAGIALIAALLPPAGALAMRGAAPSPQLATDVASSLACMGVLLPLSLLSVVGIVRMGARGRRKVRALCVEILAQHLSSGARGKREAR